jgi:hypothetical protein
MLLCTSLPKVAKPKLPTAEYSSSSMNRDRVIT